MELATARMTLQWCVLPAKLRPITTAVQRLMVITRAEPGCLECSLSTSTSGNVAIRYVEQWRSEADLQREIRSSRFTALAELMEQAVDCPAAEFVVQGATRGLDYAEAVRATGDERDAAKVS